MRLTPLLRIAALLPVFALIGWFLAEQLPVWLAPPPPWERYPDLIALPMGCEAALTLATTGASLTSAPPSAAVDAVIAEQIETQFPESAYTLLVTPQGTRYADGSAGWFALVNFTRDDGQSLARGAALFFGAEGAVNEVIYLVGGDSARGERCGDFAPQPSGLRARLRPFLPLIALAGYLGVLGVLAVLSRTRPPRRR